jgi:hypothetical protein
MEGNKQGEEGTEEYHSDTGISTLYPMRAKSELTFPLQAGKTNSPLTT